MIRLIVIVLVVALGWMIWWAFGSTALERSLTAWIDERRAEGWAADVATLEVQGFPNRFDTTLSEVRLADPATGVAWSAEFLQLLALAYRPTEVIAVLPNDHTLSTPLQTLEFSHDQARGSIYLRPSPSLPLDRSTVVIDGLRLTSSLGWDAALTQGRFATETVPARQNAHRIGAEFLELELSRDMQRIIDPRSLLPDTVDRLRLDADVGFTKAWDRSAIEVARPQITDVKLNDLSAEWGSVKFRAAGEFTVDDRGVPDGIVTLRAEDWRKMLEIAEATGLVPEAFVSPLENGLRLMAGLSGRPDTIDTELRFANGLVSVGPIPIGPAPRFVIR
ncbi:MAG: DUF2125 domain-containing protein [Pseudomonadota bacterium]